MFDVFSQGLSTVPYANKERTANNIQKIIKLSQSLSGANKYEEKNTNSISQPTKR